MRPPFFSILAAFACSFGLSAMPVQALGIRILNQDAEAYARGNAFTATADNPSAIYYNPAGITQLPGGNIELGIYAVTFDSNVKPAGSNQSYDTPLKIQEVPQIYLTYTIPDVRLSFGLGIYAPFGLGSEYDDNTPFRTIGTKSTLAYLTVNPVVAYKLTKTLSIAAGFGINYGSADFRRGIVVPGDEFRFKGDGFGYGFTLGMLWQPTTQHSFGVTYRSATRLDLRGETDVSSLTPLLIPSGSQRATTKLDLPQQIVGGYSFRPTPDWNLEVDLDWTDWSQVQQISLHEATGDLTTVFNWHSGFTLSVGATRYFKNGFSLSAGYYYCPNATPDANYTPIVPDTDLHGFTIGGAYHHDHWKIALTYGFAYGEDHTVTGSAASPIGQTADGRYKFTGNAVSLAVGYSF